MCDKAKGYLSVVREYSREITMLLGFVVAAVVYTDNKAQTESFKDQMQRMTDAMVQVTMQLHDLEKKIEYSNKSAEK